MISIKKRRPLVFVAVLAILAVGCTVDETGTKESDDDLPGGDSEAVVSVFATDNLSTDYRAVWVRLKTVTAVDTDGTAHELFHNASGEVLNLNQIAGIGRLLSAANLPAGMYRDFNITLASPVILVSAVGDAIDAGFTVDGSDKIVAVRGQLVVNAGNVTAVALDFDLAQFTYDSSSQIVAPAVAFTGVDTVMGLTTTWAKREGRISEMLSPRRFTLQDGSGGADITVSVNDQTTIIREADGVAGSTSLKTGLDVDVSGGYNPVDRTIAAQLILIDDDAGNTGGGGGAGSIGLACVEGEIQEWTGADPLILSVDEADFFAPGSGLAVIGAGSAQFYGGRYDQLAEGVQVDIAGVWDGTRLTALYMAIDEDDDGSPGSGVTPPPLPTAITTVADIEDNSILVGSLVVMKGRITEWLDSDDASFSDASGTINADFDGAPPPYPELNVPIEITVQVDGSEVEVYRHKEL